MSPYTPLPNQKNEGACPCGRLLLGKHAYRKYCSDACRSREARRRKQGVDKSVVWEKPEEKEVTTAYMTGAGDVSFLSACCEAVGGDLPNPCLFSDGHLSRDWQAPEGFSWVVSSKGTGTLTKL